MFFKRETKRAAKEAHHDARGAEALWEKIHAPANSGFDGATPNSEVIELAEIFQAVRVVRDDPAEEARLSIESQSTFAPTHARLMQAIESDVASRQTHKSSFRAPSFHRVLDTFSFGHSSGWRWAAVATVLMTTALGSHSIGYQRALKTLSAPTPATAVSSSQNVAGARVLPVQSLVDDFDQSLRSQAPFEFVSDERETPAAAAKRQQSKLGVAIHLPVKLRSGAKMLGARRHSGGGRPGVQAHYVKDGVRIGVYQIREPACGMGNLNEVEWKGNLFLTGARGSYHVVAWRSGDDIMTMVSPLAMNEHDALLLAAAMRGPGFA